MLKAEREGLKVKCEWCKNKGERQRRIRWKVEGKWYKAYDIRLTAKGAWLIGMDAILYFVFLTGFSG